MVLGLDVAELPAVLILEGFVYWASILTRIPAMNSSMLIDVVFGEPLEGLFFFVLSCISNFLIAILKGYLNRRAHLGM